MRVNNTPLKQSGVMPGGRHVLGFRIARLGTVALAAGLSLSLSFPVYQTALALETPPPTPIPVAPLGHPIPSTGTLNMGKPSAVPLPAIAKPLMQGMAVEPLAAQPSAQALTYVFQPRDLSNEQLSSVTQTLSDAGIVYKTAGILDLRVVQTIKGSFVILPLVRRLEPAELDALTQYVEHGGKLLVLPPEDLSDPNLQALFQVLELPVDVVSFVSQSMDMKSAQFKKAAKGVQGALPIGSQVLVLKPNHSAKVLAMWGEDFPAVVVSPKVTLLNWQWGQELTPEANVAILAELTGITPGKTAKKNAETENPFGFLSPGYQDAASWTMTPAQFERDRRILDEYKNTIYDAIETSLMLDINLTINTIQQKMLQGEFEKTRFENYYEQGRYAEAQTAFRQSKKQMLDALSLTSTSPRVEGRAIWLDRGTIVDSGSPAGLKKVLAKLKKAGINVVYFETVNAGFAMFPSKLTKPNPLIENWDPLATAVEEGHKLGMEVHAWVWCFAVGNKRHNPIVGKDIMYPGPILEDGQMMSEALRGPTGNLLPDGRQHEFWLSPASPKARQYLSDLYAEIISNYNVDGLHLDYIRFPFQKPGTLMGFDPVTRAQFAHSTGMSVDHMSENTYRVWVAWKTYQVSSFVKGISERMRGIKPNLKISAAVFPLPRASRIVAIQQDWETWVENGWVDILSPMSYTTSPRVLQKTFASVENGTKKKALVYPGIAINKLDSDQLLRQLDALREKGALGSTIFAMAHLDDVKVDALGNGPYKEKGISSPHKDPVNATLMLAGEYSDKFDRLLKFQELNGMTAEQLALLKQYLTAFKSSLNNMKAPASGPQTVSNDPNVGLQTARSNLSGLTMETNRWLQQEKSPHPFRYQYFNELVLRMEQMVDYLSAYYQPHKAENLQANFMMMVEEARQKQAEQQKKTAPGTPAVPGKAPEPSAVSPQPKHQATDAPPSSTL